MEAPKIKINIENPVLLSVHQLIGLFGLRGGFGPRCTAEDFQVLKDEGLIKDATFPGEASSSRLTERGWAVCKRFDELSDKQKQKERVQ